MTRRFAPLACAATIGALTLAALATPAAAQTRERCYGVSRAGQADGVGETEAPNSGVVDFQGDAWTWVAEGACPTLPLPEQPDGTPRRGSYEPLDRDLP